MQIERSYVNAEEGAIVCCWQAPSLEKIAGLFAASGAAYDKIMPVEEMAYASGECCGAA